jgi:hypothetical protein
MSQKLVQKPEIVEKPEIVQKTELVLNKKSISNLVLFIYFILLILSIINIIILFQYYDKLKNKDNKNYLLYVAIFYIIVTIVLYIYLLLFVLKILSMKYHKQYIFAIISSIYFLFLIGSCIIIHYNIKKYDNLLDYHYYTMIYSYINMVLIVILFIGYCIYIFLFDPISPSNDNFLYATGKLITFLIKPE